MAWLGTTDLLIAQPHLPQHRCALPSLLRKEDQPSTEDPGHPGALCPAPSTSHCNCSVTACCLINSWSLSFPTWLGKWGEDRPPALRGVICPDPAFLGTAHPCWELMQSPVHFLWVEQHCLHLVVQIRSCSHHPQGHSPQWSGLPGNGLGCGHHRDKLGTVGHLLLDLHA